MKLTIKNLKQQSKKSKTNFKCLNVITSSHNTQLIVLSQNIDYLHIKAINKGLKLIFMIRFWLKNFTSLVK